MADALSVLWKVSLNTHLTALLNEGKHKTDISEKPVVLYEGQRYTCKTKVNSFW